MRFIHDFLSSSAAVSESQEIEDEITTLSSMSYERWKIFSMNFCVHVDLLLIFYVRGKLALHHWTLLSTLVGINMEFKIPETKKFWNIKKSSDKNTINTGLSLAIFCHWMHILSIAWNAHTTNHVCQLAHRLFLHFLFIKRRPQQHGLKKKSMNEWVRWVQFSATRSKVFFS